MFDNQQQQIEKEFQQNNDMDDFFTQNKSKPNNMHSVSASPMPKAQNNQFLMESPIIFNQHQQYPKNQNYIFCQSPMPQTFLHSDQQFLKNMPITPPHQYNHQNINMNYSHIGNLSNNQSIINNNIIKKKTGPILPPKSKKKQLFKNHLSQQQNSTIEEQSESSEKNTPNTNNLYPNFYNNNNRYQNPNNLETFQNNNNNLNSNKQTPNQQQYYLQRICTPNQETASNKITPSTAPIQTPNNFTIQQQTQSYNINQNITPMKDMDDDEPSGNTRSSRGLRMLSLKVKDIVCELGKTSYKEVAEKLINELEKAKTITTDKTQKDEQNVKRRVYDALNVLIAADVLKKDGKQVYSNLKYTGKGQQNKIHPQKQKQELEDKIKQYKEVVDVKRSKVKDFLCKYLAVKNLQQRNRQLEKQQTEDFNCEESESEEQINKISAGRKKIKIENQISEQTTQESQQKQDLLNNIDKNNEINNNNQNQTCKQEIDTSCDFFISDNNNNNDNDVETRKNSLQISASKKSTCKKFPSLKTTPNIKDYQIQINGPSRSKKNSVIQNNFNCNENIEQDEKYQNNNNNFINEEQQEFNDDEDEFIDKLKFPIIAVSFQQLGEKELKVIQSKDNKKLRLKCRKAFDVYGDLDLAIQLGFHKIQNPYIMKLIEKNNLKQFIDSD
ncbi:hypothetical protein PPERSA_07696 [Pseudocohnilembus persalinus]|uniref:E2F/DP family winged-helix DNA-binding domain-containing protein n=1 Tax=Pseudocohnilembus persalinus TaxID=266149 RepID=A0A0V0QIC4_PSEPJ|nr:hypothetical protein PPERSA_07696 [Pseudocohnilembus persalinus]|eukprot:KRX02051.1 hypothetical protein PPERSA_07696 [Pseudocohnilembus persalinus]